MRPVPVHLRPILTALKELRCAPGQSGVSGALKCQCGSEAFVVSYVGKRIQERGEHFLRVAMRWGRPFFVIRAKCQACAQEHLVLDFHRHGWEGVLNSTAKDRDAALPAFSQWECSTCAAVTHAVAIQVRGDDQNEALLNGEGQLDEANWFEAFGSMSISVKCPGPCASIAIADYEAQ